MDNALTVLVRPEWTIRDRLRKARDVAGLSQAELALATGVHRRTIVNYELGKTVPTLQPLVKIAQVTRVDWDWLVVDHLSPDDVEAGRVLLAMAHEYIYTRDAVDDSAVATDAA